MLLLKLRASGNVSKLISRFLENPSEKWKVCYVISGGVDEEDLVSGALSEARGCALLDLSGFQALASCTFSLSCLMQMDLSLNS